MKDHVKEMLEQGLTGAEIARRLGVSETRISRLARRLGYQGLTTKPLQYDWAAIRAYYEQGRTMQDCKRRFGFSNGAWDQAATRGDIEPRRDRATRAPGLTNRAVKRLLEEGLTVSEIARELGVKKGTVCYHRRRLGYPMDERCNRRYDWAEVQRYYDSGKSKRECQAHFGFTSASWYDAVARGSLTPRPAAAPLSTYLVAGRRVNRTHLKGRLLAAGLKENRCERCAIGDWIDQPLSLCLHHVNGDGDDNRLVNIQFLCPNCHSQTENFAGRNVGRLVRAQAAA